ILGVCEDVHAWASNNERRFVCVVLHAGKHPDPEPGETPASYSSQDEE
ncbi:barstar family protein 2, partial [Alcaligenes faecalis]|nr:barstar family protein 2 [Alcaligenes faecalis]MBH0312686.1 barstar family protein 2 [Alcaligenes faecalis]